MFENTSFDVIISHKDCSDGKASKWIATRYSTVSTNAQYFECEAGCAFTSCDITDKSVLMLDIMSSNIEHIVSKAKYVVVIDHHISNQIVLQKLIPLYSNLQVVYDIKRCGAQIAWDEFVPNTPRPWFIEVIADKDLWKWQIPGSKEIEKALIVLVEENPNIYDELLHWSQHRVDSIVDKGKLIIAQEAMLIKQMVNQAVPATFTWLDKIYHILITSSIPNLGSEVGSILSKRDDCDIAALYKYDLIKDEWYISLRSSSDDVNVSEISAHFGGGGHIRAAGFKLQNGMKLRDVFNMIS